MKIAPPTAPKRRQADAWHAYMPGLLLIGLGILAHGQGWIGEHPTMAIIGFGGLRLPRGRLRDGKRWLLAENTRTDEHRSGRHG